MKASPEIQLDFVPRRDNSSFRTRKPNEILRSQTRIRESEARRKEAEYRRGINNTDPNIVDTRRVIGIDNDKIGAEAIIIVKDPKDKKLLLALKYVSAVPAETANTDWDLIFMDIMSRVFDPGRIMKGPVLNWTETFGSDFAHLEAVKGEKGFIMRHGGVVFATPEETRGRVGIYHEVNPDLREMLGLPVKSPELQLAR